MGRILCFFVNLQKTETEKTRWPLNMPLLYFNTQNFILCYFLLKQKCVGSCVSHASSVPLVPNSPGCLSCYTLFGCFKHLFHLIQYKQTIGYPKTDRCCDQIRMYLLDHRDSADTKSPQLSPNIYIF